MKICIIEKKHLSAYKEYLREQEQSELTIEKYIRDVRGFSDFTAGRPLSKDLVLEYKEKLIKNYAVASVNSMLSALNGFFDFLKRPELKVKQLKVQRRNFLKPEEMLSQEEYRRLLSAAKDKGNERLNLLMQTICATGIRVSELKFITVEATRIGRVEIMNKGKQRTILIVQELRKVLLSYANKRGIESGCIFVSRNGNPLSRHCIWADMKALSESAGVDPAKVFPHNLRHLFARTFYSLEKDLVRLADILGHSNINTTRIYTMESGLEHMRILSKLSLVYT